MASPEILACPLEEMKSFGRLDFTLNFPHISFKINRDFLFFSNYCQDLLSPKIHRQYRYYCCRKRIIAFSFSERSLSYSDESRLSNLLRRITREDDRDRRLATVKQLKEFIQQPENKLVSSFYFSIALEYFAFYKTVFKKSEYWDMFVRNILYTRNFFPQQKKVYSCIVCPFSSIREIFYCLIAFDVLP